MAALQYKEYILISRPHYDDRVGLWIPYASAAWNGDKFHYHQLTDLNRNFETQEEAEAFGFVVARAWVDKNGKE